VIDKMSKEKSGEVENTLELKFKRKKKCRDNEGSTIAQSSSKKTRSIPEEQIPVPTSNPSSKNTNSTPDEQIPFPTSKPSSKKTRSTPEEQVLDPTSKPYDRNTRSEKKKTNENIPT
jgi:hypothetical protein